MNPIRKLEEYAKEGMAKMREMIILQKDIRAILRDIKELLEKGHR